MNQEITRLIDNGYSIITSTQRLSRHLAASFAALQVEQGKLAWETPDILPWNAWLQRTWLECVVTNSIDYYLLNRNQQLCVFQDIIRRSRYGKKLLQLHYTARQVQHAWQLCQQWEIPVFPDHTFLGEDAVAFKTWAISYQQQCEKMNWFDEDILPTKLSENILSVKTPLKLAFAGFDEFTPQQDRLLNHLSASGFAITVVPVTNRNQSVVATGFRDKNMEIRSAAQWARKKIEESASATVGIVVPNLSASYERLWNTFSDVFHPESILMHREAPPPAFNIALGQPLLSYAPVDIVFTILDLGNMQWQLHDLGKLLRSPFIAAAGAEYQTRTRFDVALRRLCETRVTPDTIQNLITSGKVPTHDVPKSFMRICLEFHTCWRNHSGNKKLSVWAVLFSELLKIFGWPGERILTSSEFQIVNEWQELLKQLAGLDKVCGKSGYRDALAQLRQLAANHHFQPETAETPVQILGVTGVAGMSFDHLWFMGLQEDVWPTRSEPNPFVPIDLQRTVGITDASPDLKLNQALQITEKLVGSAREVVLSYPCIEDDRKLRPSSLIKPYLLRSSEFQQQEPTEYAEVLFHSGALEQIDDTFAPEISSGETVSGGAGLFRDQAACPFRAFARYRLDAQGLDCKDIGLDTMQRGSIVHTIMEKFWKQINNFQSLIKLDELKLESLIRKVVSDSITVYQQQFPQTFTPQFISLEKKRLEILLKNWMDEERKRQPFRVVEIEKWHTLQINDVTIKLRIDRLDQLEDGRFVVIDYKTGKADIRGWFDERPDEPQLPLYAISIQGEIAAIVFARLIRGESRFSGIAQERDILPDTITLDQVSATKDQFANWNDLFDYWQKILQQLATGFRTGFALVDPKDHNTCRYCDLHTLCRITEVDFENILSDQEHEF